MPLNSLKPWSLLLLVGAAAHAATLTYSGPDGGEPAPCNDTLTACIQGAAAGDTVEIATNTPITTENFQLSKSITVRSKPGFAATISRNGLDASINDTAGPIQVTLDGLTITGGHVTGFFQQNSNDTLTITNCTLNGGIDMNGAHPYSLTVKHSKIGGDPNLDLRQNTSADGTTVVLDGNEISSPNAANNSEGLDLLFEGTGAFTASITNNIFHDLASCNCGASTMVVFDATKANNVGGSSIQFLNNVLDGSAGTGLLVEQPSSGVLRVGIHNNVFSNLNQGYSFPASMGSAQIDFHANDNYLAPNNVGGYGLHGEDNTAVDPHYVNRAAHDYRLQSTSTLINTGEQVAGLTTTDFAGQPRITEGSVDKGAYERNADLSVQLSGNPSAPAVDADVTYTMTVSNAGSYDVTDASAVFNLPAGMLFKSSSASTGSCAGTTQVTCAVGALKAGSSVDATIVATATTKGNQSVSATVSGGPSDPDSSNNSVSLVTHTGQVADAGTPSTDAGTGTGADAGEKKGCGCTSTSAELPGLGLLLALGMLAARRRA